MRIRNINISVCILAVLSSCGKQIPLENSRSDIGMDVTIATHEMTKGIVSGTSFPQNTTIGLFICSHEEGTPSLFEEYSPKYNNIQATQSSSTIESPVWSYKYNGTGTAFPTLFLLKPQTGEPAADFYAYAPFVSGATNPTDIPFSLSAEYRSLQDILYASENDTDVNKGKVPDGSLISIKFHFVHKLAWLQCQFYLKNDDEDGSHGPESEKDSQNKTTVNSIVLRKKTGGSTPLYSSGAFNFIDGTFKSGSLVDAESLEVKYNYSFGTKGNTFNMLVYPEEYLADGDYELVFNFDGNTMETVYSIKVSDLLHSDGVTTGFKEGYRYVLSFTYDNYNHIHLDRTQVDTDADWTEFPEQKEIVI